MPNPTKDPSLPINANFEIGIQLRWLYKEVVERPSGCQSCGSAKKVTTTQYFVPNMVPCAKNGYWYWKQLPEDSNEGYSLWIETDNDFSIVEIPEHQNLDHFIEGTFIAEMRGLDVDNVTPENKRPANQIGWYRDGRYN